MKRANHFGVILGLFAAALTAAGGEVPRQAPDFAVQTGPDQYIWLNDYAGKTVIVAFILTTCPHCQYTTGLLIKMAKDYEAKGVKVIESAIEPMSSLNIPGFVKKMGTTFPVGYDDQGYVAKFLGYPETEPFFLPQIVMIDKKGMIRAQITNDMPGMQKEAEQEGTLRAKLDEILGSEGKPTGHPVGPAPVHKPATITK